MSEQCVLLCNFLSVYEHQYPEMCLFTNKHKQGCVHYHDLNCLVTTNTCMEVQHNEYLLVPLQKVTPKLCHKPYSDCTIYSTITSPQAGCHIKNILGNVEHCAASMSKWHWTGTVYIHVAKAFTSEIWDHRTWHVAHLNKVCHSIACKRGRYKTQNRTEPEVTVVQYVARN